MNLKTKSIALVTVCFVVIFAVSCGLLQLLSRDIIAGLATMYAKEQVNYNRSRVLQPLLRELGLALKLADSTIIRNWALHETDAASRASALRELDEYRRFFSDRSFFFAIKESGNYYYNDSGNRYKGAELRYRLDPASPDDLWFYRTLESNQDYALNVDFDEKLLVTKVWINVVVRDAGRPVGVIGTGIDLTKFLASVVASEHAGVTSMFIENSGAIQADSKQNLIDFRSISKAESERKTIFQLMDSQSDVTHLREIMLRLKAGENQTEVFTASIGGTDYLVGVGAIREIGWYNLTLLKTSSIIGSRYIIPFALLLFVALLLLTAALVMLLNRLVIDRIARLDNLIVAFAKGGTIVFPGGNLPDEMGRLENSFHQMSVSLREHEQELENKVAERTRELAAKNIELNQALSEIKVLSGLLPICMYCKEIRDDSGAWTRLENYIEKHSTAQFSHGLCDKCLAEKFPAQYKKRARNLSDHRLENP